MPLLMPVVLASLLFAVGIYGVLARRNAILVLMSVELMLNAVNLNLVAFDVYLRDPLLAGQVFTLFVITIAAAEVGLGLAIVLLVFRNRATSQLDEVTELRETDDDAAADAVTTGSRDRAVAS
jgi:NADH-quinone oxidoreductase subunit K